MENLEKIVEEIVDEYGRQCAVCEYKIGNDPYTHTYLSKECLEYSLEGWSQEMLDKIYTKPSYQELPPTCEHYKNAK